MNRYFVTFNDCNGLKMAEYAVEADNFPQAVMYAEVDLAVDEKDIRHVFSVLVVFSRVL